MPREADWWMNVTPSLPLTEATIEVEGLPIYYRTGGSGPPLLLLHGGTLIGAHWNPFLDAFGEHYTVIVPDLPGCGRSPRFVSEGAHFSANGRVMFGLLDALGVDRICGVGFSWGAGILLHMAAQHPERVEAIVPIGCPGWQRPRPEIRIADWNWEDLDQDLRARLLARHPGGRPQIEAISAEARRFEAAVHESNLSPEQLAKTPTRTLLIFGDRDQFNAVELAVETYRALPNAMLWIVPGEGHGPP